MTHISIRLPALIPIRLFSTYSLTVHFPIKHNFPLVCSAQICGQYFANQHKFCSVQILVQLWASFPHGPYIAIANQDKFHSAQILIQLLSALLPSAASTNLVQYLYQVLEEQFPHNTYDMCADGR